MIMDRFVNSDVARDRFDLLHASVLDGRNESFPWFRDAFSLPR